MVCAGGGGRRRVSVLTRATPTGHNYLYHHRRPEGRFFLPFVTRHEPSVIHNFGPYAVYVPNDVGRDGRNGHNRITIPVFSLLIVDIYKTIRDTYNVCNDVYRQLFP